MLKKNLQQFSVTNQLGGVITNLHHLSMARLIPADLLIRGGVGHMPAAVARSDAAHPRLRRRRSPRGTKTASAECCKFPFHINSPFRKGDDLDSIYSYPEYYEIAYSYRNIPPAEADVMEEAMAKYSLIPVQSVLELACGNSPPTCSS